MSHRNGPMASLGESIPRLLAAGAVALLFVAPVPARAAEVLFVSDTATAGTTIRNGPMASLGESIPRLLAAGAVALLFVAPVPARAAEVLFVSDTATAGTTIPEALRADGHTVTVVSGDFDNGNAALRVDLDRYQLVVWSASGRSNGDRHQDPALFTHLEAYVTGGGRVFVTGYDSIASPTDPLLIAFLGGTGSRDVPPVPGAIISVANSLTVGIVDIRGLTPTGAAGDRDALTGLLPDTVLVCPSSTDASQGQWTLRTLGAGQIAWVSNGTSGSGAHASWIVRAMGPSGAFNGALRNFAASASGARPVVAPADPPDPTPPVQVPDLVPALPPTPVTAPRRRPRRPEFNSDARSGFGWVVSIHTAGAHTTEEQRWFVGGSAAVGLRFNLDREGADERRNGTANGLLGDSFGVDVRGHLFGRVDSGRDTAFAVAVGGALVSVNALRGGDVRIPSLVGLLLPEVGAIFRDDAAPRPYLAFHAPFSFLLEPWLSLELRASLFFVDGWRMAEGREMLLSVSIGLAVR